MGNLTPFPWVVPKGVGSFWSYRLLLAIIDVNLPLATNQILNGAMWSLALMYLSRATSSGRASLGLSGQEVLAESRLQSEWFQ